MPLTLDFRELRQAGSMSDRSWRRILSGGSCNAACPNQSLDVGCCDSSCCWRRVWLVRFRMGANTSASRGAIAGYVCSSCGYVDSGGVPEVQTATRCRTLRSVRQRLPEAMRCRPHSLLQIRSRHPQRLSRRLRRREMKYRHQLSFLMRSERCLQSPAPERQAKKR